jgi:hypothetical protein
LTIKRALVIALAAAIAIAFSPLQELRAAPFGPSSQAAGGDLVQLIQAKKASKKKAKKKKKSKRKKAGKGGKSCGTYMYRKGGKCVDARNKK